MSTRCVIAFGPDLNPAHVRAMLYRHSDGYPKDPSGVLADLKKFFGDVDPGVLEDPTYLASRLAAWQEGHSAKYAQGKPLAPQALSPAIYVPPDIEYAYVVACTGKMPKVKVFKPEAFNALYPHKSPTKEYGRPDMVIMGSQFADWEFLPVG